MRKISAVAAAAMIVSANAALAGEQWQVKEGPQGQVSGVWEFVAVTAAAAPAGNAPSAGRPGAAGHRGGGERGDERGGGERGQDRGTDGSQTGEPRKMRHHEHRHENYREHDGHHDHHQRSVTSPSPVAVTYTGAAQMILPSGAKLTYSLAGSSQNGIITFRRLSPSDGMDCSYRGDLMPDGSISGMTLCGPGKTVWSAKKVTATPAQ
jgi:hypothetical protein